MKKDQNLPNKNIHTNNKSGNPLPDYKNTSRQQSPYRNSYRGRSPNQRNSQPFLQNRYNRSNCQNNLYFQKLVDKLEQAEITTKLEEAESVKIQYANNIQKWYSEIQKNNQ